MSGKKGVGQRTGRLLPMVVVGVGWLLLLAGLGAGVGYLGLPLLAGDEGILAAQLGQMAALFLGLFGGSLAVYHGLRALAGRPSQQMRLPHVFFFGLVFAVVLGLGNVLLNFDIMVNFLFPFLFLAGAALPTFAVLAWAGRRLGWPLTWRQTALMLVSGSTLSVLVTIILGSAFPFFIYLLVDPLAVLAGSMGDVLSSGAPGFLERFFVSPMIIVFLVVTALQAPIPEELAKALGPLLMGRRIGNERQAFLIGMVSGAGFAILENMLYEGLYAQWSGWSWGGVTLLRGIGAVLHPICSGFIALALFRERQREPGWFGRLGRAYLVAVGLHTLWNGGFEALLALTGIDYYGGLGDTLNLYGESVAVMLVVFLVILSLSLWWLLARVTRDLSLEVEVSLRPVIVTRRAVAVWAFACAAVIVPIGATLVQAWGGMAAFFE
jgi:RsiW-degrading membrane proteinase PrsW (M82 family)